VNGERCRGRLAVLPGDCGRDASLGDDDAVLSELANVPFVRTASRDATLPTVTSQEDENHEAGARRSAADKIGEGWLVGPGVVQVGQARQNVTVVPKLETGAAAAAGHRQAVQLEVVRQRVERHVQLADEIRHLQL